MSDAQSVNRVAKKLYLVELKDESINPAKIEDYKDWFVIRTGKKPTEITPLELELLKEGILRLSLDFITNEEQKALLKKLDSMRA